MKIIVEQIRYNKRGVGQMFPQTLYKGYRGRFYHRLFSTRLEWELFFSGMIVTVVSFSLGFWSGLFLR